MERISLCPGCTACPEVVIDGDTIRIGGQPFRISAEVIKEPDRMTGSLNVGPRVMMSRAAMERMIRANPNSEHLDEVQFRRGEYFFTRRKFRDAENAYSAVTKLGPGSSYYELALYKLGWTFYKQELYEDALQRYMALLDYKVSTGYDFDQKHEKEDERRVADAFRAVSLSFSRTSSHRLGRWAKGR